MTESKEFNLDVLQALQEVTLGTNHVERWQGTPQMFPYNVSTHAYNCAMLYMQLCSVCRKKLNERLLGALLCHDNMESLTGDLLAPAKDSAEDSWDSIEEQVQEKWRKDHNIPAVTTRTFLPVEEDYLSNLDREGRLLLKIIDMAEFLFHAQQEYKAGNRCSKVMDGLKYGGASLRHKIHAVKNACAIVPSSHADIVDIVACIKYYYNRQCSNLSLSDDYYV